MDFVALPKIELHAHLTGSISRCALHHVWQRKHAAGETDLADPLTVMPEGKHDYNVKEFFPLFSSYIYKLLTDEASVRDTTLSVLSSFLADGVVYLELRTTPRATASLSMERYVALLVTTIAEFQAAHSRMHVRLILSVDRSRHDPETAAAVLALALAHRPCVVGIDLCGDPTVGAVPVSVFAPVFAAAADAGLGITLHFAEAATEPRSDLLTLLDWRPRRLGHVIHVDEELRARIVALGVCLELCLTCNVKAAMIDGGFEAHHLGEWRGVEGVKISLATDDVGVFGSPLSNEYRIAAEHFNLGRDQVCALARDAISHIFAGEEEKQRLREILW